MKPYVILRFTPFYVLIALFWANTLVAQIPGQSYFDDTEYIEYIAGNYPLIISIPHGGYEVPNEIADRNCDGCVYSRDSYTQEIGRSIAQYFHDQTGYYPHLIINLLDRSKLDTNRSLEDGGADGDPIGEEAWTNYQNFIEDAKTKITQDFGRGLLIDLHGHGHTIKRIELGYILTHSDLNTTDEELNEQVHINRNSTKNLVNDNVMNLTHSELVRGPLSFGGLIHDKGYPAVPSPAIPYPDFADPYFNGGYNVYEHGAHFNNAIDAFQIECDQNIRIYGGESARDEFAELCAVAINEYLSLHYGIGTIDFDGDGAMSDIDCDDSDSNINPSAQEVPYNGIDDDCDPNTLDDDLDQDGFDNANDCDDSDPNINPDAEEIPYNGIDDDCDPATLDDDLDQDGFDNANDCDDSDPNINPNTDEIPYNGIDDDCDPATLDDDLDQDGFNNANDCDDSDPNINPGAEEVPYNGIDDDCDPATLDDDLDQDGFNQADDCDDSDPDINPNAVEILGNQIDENCDGTIETTTTSEPEPEPEPEPELKNKNDFIIYPNPANQNLYIEKTDNNDFKIEIFDVNHRLVLIIKNQSSFSIQNLSNGMYYLVYRDLLTGKRINKKLIIQK